MEGRYRFLCAAAAAAVAISLGACRLDTGFMDALSPPYLTGIRVTGDSVVQVGDSVRLGTFGETGGPLGMFFYDPLDDAVWAVSDAGVARLEPIPTAPPTDSSRHAQALVWGVRPGTVQATVSARRIVGTVSVRVIPVIAGVTLRSARDTVAVGDTVRISVAASDAAGQPVVDVPFAYAVSGGAYLRAAGTAGVQLVATAPGPAIVTASFRRASAEVTVVVRSPEP